ncbi:MAG: 50S ribosomal protein L21 [Candidatus Muiribacteriota bacterium]
MYAIVQTGGKQYRVEPNMTFKIEKIDVNENGKVELDKVLMVNDGKDIKVGDPYVSNAKVLCSLEEQGKNKKIRVFRYKPKKKYRRVTGHRQPYTALKVNEIKLK